jgi:hypothetical protein
MGYNTQYLELMSENVDFPIGASPVSLESIFGDGVSYSDGLFFQSPEGNFYGQTKIVRDYYLPIVWDGTRYIKVKPTANVRSVEDLPPQGMQHFEQVAIPRTDATREEIDRGYVYDVHFWDSVSQAWIKIDWLWNIDKPSAVPYPGVGVGKAHLFIKKNQQMIWDGYKWKPFPVHSNIVDDEPERHMPEGFITNYEDYQTNTNGAIQFLQSNTADARLEFMSKESLGLITSVTGKSGALWINGELLLISLISNVSNSDQYVHYVDGTITYHNVEPNTEYYVYCGNTNFPLSKKLFLSHNEDINGRLGDEEPGTNARIVGIVETDSAGYFIREIDMSYIGKRIEFSQTYWEYSDYQLQFASQDKLEFNRIDGTHGLFYINGQIISLGTGRDLFRDSYRIEWDNGPDLDASDISADTSYQIYIANDSNEYNFNAENPQTGYPLEEGDVGYVWQLDFRRRLFLSTQPHDHRTFNQEYPGYYARHIGQIETDTLGYFKYSADISLIRQPTLNPTHLDGLAECVVQDYSAEQFYVVRKKATQGNIYINGTPIKTYSLEYLMDHPDAETQFKITLDSPLYDYTEIEIDEPLIDNGTKVKDKPGLPIYVYMANDEECFNGIRIFVTLRQDESGYLSSNWPGCNCRWVATIQLSPATFGNELLTNGNFESDSSSWTAGTGWEHVPANEYMFHEVNNTATLSQNISVSADSMYAVTFYISDWESGTVTPQIGGASGKPVSQNTSNTQYLLAEDTSGLSLLPDRYFVGAVDRVSVKRVTSGQFTGSYVKDSIGGMVASIDDSISSSSTTYSSNKIEQIRQELRALIDAAFGLTGQYTTIPGLILEYVDASTIKLRALDDDVIVNFPTLVDEVTVTSAGIELTPTGVAEQLYYVYLNSGGDLWLSDGAPDAVFPSVQFLGDNNMLVGYLGFASTDTLAGTHNVFSFWNEPQRTYTHNTTSMPSTALTLDGFVIPPEESASVVWAGNVSGSSIASGDTGRYKPMGCPTQNATATTTQSTVGTTTQTASATTQYFDWITYDCAYYPISVTRSQTISVSLDTVTEPVSNLSITLIGNQTSQVSSPGWGAVLVSESFTSISGTITLTRPGS